VDENQLAWFKLKQRLNGNKRSIFFREGEVWWCALGLNVGSEENGKNTNFERPVIILCKFGGNMFLGLPLTSRPRYGRFYYTFRFRSNNSTVILSQLRSLSTKRLMRSMGKVDMKPLTNIKDRAKELLK